MTTFTAAEIAYITSQPLGRLATVDAACRPHVTPVGVFYDAEAQAIVVGGINMAETKKYRDVRRHPQVAIVIDDLASTNPWTPRGIEVRGRAETHPEGGREVGRRVGASLPFSPAYIRILPRRVLAWGLDGGAFELHARDVA